MIGAVRCGSARFAPSIRFINDYRGALVMGSYVCERRGERRCAAYLTGYEVPLAQPVPHPFYVSKLMEAHKRVLEALEADFDLPYDGEPWPVPVDD